MGARHYDIALADAARIWDVVCGAHQGREGVIGNPDILIERYDAAHGKRLTRQDIELWSSFEYAHVDWSHVEFSNIMGLSSVGADTTLYLITDEGLVDQRAFRFQCSELEGFVEWYETRYRADFFQASDYVLFDAELRYVRILHHAGAVFASESAGPGAR